MATVQCPQCQSDNDAVNAYCLRCGTDLPLSVVSPPNIHTIAGSLGRLKPSPSGRLYGVLVEVHRVNWPGYCPCCLCELPVPQGLTPREVIAGCFGYKVDLNQWRIPYCNSCQEHIKHSMHLRHTMTPQQKSQLTEELEGEMGPDCCHYLDSAWVGVAKGSVRNFLFRNREFAWVFAEMNGVKVKD